MLADEQYSVGVEAGRELLMMHEVEAPENMEAWSMRRIAKHNRQLAEYCRCGAKLPEEDAIIAFIDGQLPLLEGRPNRFQHDDFHPGNLLVHGGSYVAAIDFNRYDWGDPYHDFLKIAYFSREVSIPFSIGQIDGYFNGMIPENFWNLYALYSTLIMFGTITWTLQVVRDILRLYFLVPGCRCLNFWDQSTTAIGPKRPTASTPPTRTAVNPARIGR
ncbi:aminoglycoside phosphotransferase family protein [Paenibacillus filicis]|uniref:Aminoglycoside phosphotransferase family protein n=1 Tax=Paenibacillus gyeongsangnamensis TaxID=3388067 RepID=A0ABT4QLJ3_9BACL|nr:aminoglycoside phosphotransferase family protein [Paenibacillus filicis]MCZ8517737.1 aminoglycoside phosphotransferase family protein [Paenibacillus filicis]